MCDPTDEPQSEANESDSKQNQATDGEDTQQTGLPLFAPVLLLTQRPSQRA
jgi:hypothetical protein